MSPLRLNCFKDSIKYVLYHTSNQENQYQECTVDKNQPAISRLENSEKLPLPRNQIQGKTN